MQGLSDLEHTRILGKDTTSRSRYTWECIVGLILFIVVAGFLVKSTHRQNASQHHVLAVQIIITIYLIYIAPFPQT
jgi:undecaprenyl pyrophosphate phosphatase UppP